MDCIYLHFCFDFFLKIHFYSIMIKVCYIKTINCVLKQIEVFDILLTFADTFLMFELILILEDFVHILFA